MQFNTVKVFYCPKSTHYSTVIQFASYLRVAQMLAYNQTVLQVRLKQEDYYEGLLPQRAFYAACHCIARAWRTKVPACTIDLTQNSAGWLATVNCVGPRYAGKQLMSAFLCACSAP